MSEGTGAIALSVRPPHRSRAATDLLPSSPQTASLCGLRLLGRKPAAPSRKRPYARLPGGNSEPPAAAAASASRIYAQCHPSQLSQPGGRLAALRPDSSPPCPPTAAPVPLPRSVSPAHASAGRCELARHSLLERTRLCASPTERCAHRHRSLRAESPTVSHSCCSCTAAPAVRRQRQGKNGVQGVEKCNYLWRRTVASAMLNTGSSCSLTHTPGCQRPPGACVYTATLPSSYPASNASTPPPPAASPASALSDGKTVQKCMHMHCPDRTAAPAESEVSDSTSAAAWASIVTSAEGRRLRKPQAQCACVSTSRAVLTPSMGAPKWVSKVQWPRARSENWW